jgi:hypothetical protein
VAQSGTGGTDDVFAPGHIGELTQVIPPELVDVFEHLGTALVWGKLGAGLAARVPQPSEKALRDLRRRVGVAPLKRLFDVVGARTTSALVTLHVGTRGGSRRGGRVGGR